MTRMVGELIGKQWNSFVKQDLILELTGTGTLDGLTFAVKDVFEIQDYKNTAGIPD
jgi:amidase